MSPALTDTDVAIVVDGIGFGHDARVSLCTTDEATQAERRRGRLAIGPAFVEALANVNNAFPGSHTVYAGLPRLSLPECD